MVLVVARSRSVPQRRRGVRVAGASYLELEEIAALARRAIFPELTPSDRIDGMELLERLNDGVQLPCATVGPSRARVLVVPDTGLEGFTTFVGDDAPHACRFRIRLAESTYRDLHLGDPTATFTLAHEVMHVVQHGAALRSLRVMPHRDRLRSTASTRRRTSSADATELARGLGG